MDFDFKMRLIGFYNTPKQNMKEEECRLIEAEELANLLGETSRNLTHFVSDDLVFKSVLKGNTVFILKDEENNLYAYYPYKRIARLTDVVYDKRNVTPVPLRYKAWFVPGERIYVRKERKDTF